MKTKEFNFKYSPKKNERVVKFEDLKGYIENLRVGERLVVPTRFGDAVVKVVSERDYDFYQ